LLADASIPASAAESPTSIRSQYSSLDPAHCATLGSTENPDEAALRCPGVGGYKLVLIDSDSRMSLTVEPPSGAPSALNFTDVVTPYFSRLGGRAEWRVKDIGGKPVPISLIVRLFVQEEPEKPVERSYLIVSRIDRSTSCVTDKIPPSTDANARARRSADAAEASPCLKPLD
jgi:hypothetical protein